VCVCVRGGSGGDSAGVAEQFKETLAADRLPLARVEQRQKLVAARLARLKEELHELQATQRHSIARLHEQLEALQTN
jgi:hypothetical protein